MEKNSYEEFIKFIQEYQNNDQYHSDKCHIIAQKDFFANGDIVVKFLIHPVKKSYAKVIRQGLL